MNIARRSSFDPLIGIQRERGSEAELNWRPPGASDSDLQHVQYLTDVLCPQIAENSRILARPVAIREHT